VNLHRFTIIGAVLIALGLTSCNVERALSTRHRARKLAAAARELYLKGSYTDALPLFEQAVQLHPADIGAQRGMVDTRLKLQQYDLAVHNADAALARFPSDWMLLEARADAFLALDKKNEAMRDYRRCIEMDPSGYWEPWMKLASVQVAAGATAAARATYLDLLRRYPGHQGARKALTELEP